MRRYFSLVSIIVAALAVGFLSPQQAGAFVANQDGIAKAATANGVIEVKRSPSKGTPPGWHHGRKRGWEGSKRPPGQH